MLTWLGGDAFTLQDIAFQTQSSKQNTLFPERFSEGSFFVLKSRSLLEQYVDLIANLRPRNIFEIGIWRGGSTVFLATLANPRRYVAVDLADNSIASFADWLRGGPLKDHVVAHFGVDQSDGRTLRAIAASEFDGEPLDLVIDDASHVLAPTRASFEALFPCLRPGGVYVIEDWETQHVMEKEITNQINSNPEMRGRFEEQSEPSATLLARREPLTRLLAQIMLASAYTDIIDEIRIRPGSAMIRRGHEDFDQDNFAISDFYLDLGREVLQENSEQKTASD